MRGGLAAAGFISVAGVDTSNGFRDALCEAGLRAIDEIARMPAHSVRADPIAAMLQGVARWGRSAGVGDGATMNRSLQHPASGLLVQFCELRKYPHVRDFAWNKVARS